MNSSYLLQTAVQDEQTFARAEAIFAQMSVPASSIPEETVHALEDRDDSLTVELTTALMKAVYYQQLNDAAAHEYIHTSYLNFYLRSMVAPMTYSYLDRLRKLCFLQNPILSIQAGVCGRAHACHKIERSDGARKRAMAVDSEYPDGGVYSDPAVRGGEAHI